VHEILSFIPPDKKIGIREGGNTREVNTKITKGGEAHEG
jgi:hypothetical protein